jgi:hypothetical protein
MKLLHLTSAELTDKLRDARGAKRRKLLAELQRRYDETVPRTVYHPEPVRDIHGEIAFFRYRFAFNIPRYDYALFHP